jgi:hypothetical protein
LILADDLGAAGSNDLTKGAALVNAAEDKKLRRFIMRSIYFSCLTYINISNK